jgi:hypothetical protein
MVSFSFGFDLLKFPEIAQIPKSVETCRKVQKLQTQFCWTPLEQLYAVDWTKFIVVQ